MRLLLMVVSAFLLAGCTSAIQGDSTHHVSATENKYTPNAVSAKQNGKVEWKNDGSAAHTVTIHKAGDAITTIKHDVNLDAKAKTDYVFQETGTYHVFCKYHSQGTTGQFASGMVMTVTVA